MKITKAKLVKGTFLEVSFSDGNAVVNKSYPHTEAPPKLLKAFQYLNHHLCDLSEQYDGTGQPDYDNIACRSYSIKGEDEKEVVVVTGIRALKSGGTITLNSPRVNLDIAESGYHAIKVLVECLDRCRDEIKTFMENNKSPEEVQGKLFDKNNTFIVKSEKTADEEAENTAVGIIFKDVNDAIAAHEAEEEEDEEDLPEQDRMDIEMPLNQEMVAKAKAHKNKKGKK